MVILANGGGYPADPTVSNQGYSNLHSGYKSIFSYSFSFALHGQRSRFAPAVRVAPDVAADFLHKVKSLLIDDGLVGIFKDRPLTFVHIMTFLVLF